MTLPAHEHWGPECHTARAKLLARMSEWDWQQAEHAFEEDHKDCVGFLDMTPIERGIALNQDLDTVYELIWIRAQNRGGEPYDRFHSLR